MPNILNIGHRGAMAYRPENTMSSFELAVEQGADMIELDAKLPIEGDGPLDISIAIFALILSSLVSTFIDDDVWDGRLSSIPDGIAVKKASDGVYESGEALIKSASKLNWGEAISLATWIIIGIVVLSGSILALSIDITKGLGYTT